MKAQVKIIFKSIENILCTLNLYVGTHEDGLLDRTI